MLFKCQRSILLTKCQLVLDDYSYYFVKNFLHN